MFWRINILDSKPQNMPDLPIERNPHADLPKFVQDIIQKVEMMRCPEHGKHPKFKAIIGNDFVFDSCCDNMKNRVIQSLKSM